MNNFRSYGYHSDDEGLAWHKSDNEVDCPLRGATKPEIEQLSDGRIMMMIRTQTCKMYQAFSNSDGKTWSASRETSITHPEAPMLVTRLPNSDDLILIWINASVAGAGHSGPRRPLPSGVSKDNGGTWQNTRTIDNSENGEYCCASICFLNGNAHLVYHGPGSLRYQRMSVVGIRTATQ